MRTKPPSITKSFNSYKGSIDCPTQSLFQRYSSRNNVSSTPFSTRSTASSTGSITSKPRKVLTLKEIDEKGANSMCFFYDEKYYPGHKCAGQVYRLDMVEEMVCEEGQEEGIEDSVGPLIREDEQPLISL